MTFANRMPDYINRVDKILSDALAPLDGEHTILRKAMRYSVLGNGKRIRPLLVYATGEALEICPDVLDAPAAAIEMMHAFSLVHDDLPAMDNDDLRRGRATTHRAFDEATAILAADALQPLAFQLLVTSPSLAEYPETQARLVALLAEACGSEGMTGGQAIDIAAEGQYLDQDSLEHMYRLKTGRLLRASVLSAAYCRREIDEHIIDKLHRFVDSLGLAYQIRDDILDIEGATEQIGKTQGADVARKKATFPALFGLSAARQRAADLLETANAALDELDHEAEGLRWMAQLAVLREA